MNLPSDLNTIVGIFTIIGAIPAWIALYPVLKPFIKRLMGQIPHLSDSESTYLHSLAKDLESRNQTTRWSDKFYVDIDTELHDRSMSCDIPPVFYVARSISRHLKDQDFNNLSNIEKIDSSRGRSFASLEAALSEARDNAVRGQLTKKLFQA